MRPADHVFETPGIAAQYNSHDLTRVVRYTTKTRLGSIQIKRDIRVELTKVKKFM